MLLLFLSAYIFTFGIFGSVFIHLFSSQVFSTGEEDLEIDVTSVISGVLTNQLDDYGFRIAFTSSQETDSTTRFVKRFASRNTTNSSKRPKLIVTYDDLIQDASPVFEFNTSGSIFLNTFTRSERANMASGSSLTQITGTNCLKINVISGSIAKTFSGSQHVVGSVFSTGIYSSSFLLNSFDSELTSHINTSGSLSFAVYWKSNDLTVCFATTSFTASMPSRTELKQNPERYFVSITNMKTTYKDDEKVRFKLFVEDFNRSITFVKTPLEKDSIILNEFYYRIRDFESGDIIVPFHDVGTRISNDTAVHYFDIFTTSLPAGRTYTFDFKIVSKGEEIFIRDAAAKFKVE